MLGAIAQATRRIGLMTAVTCSIMRYHPAIIAQATATMGVLSDDRFNWASVPTNVSTSMWWARAGRASRSVMSGSRRPSISSRACSPER